MTDVKVGANTARSAAYFNTFGFTTGNTANQVRTNSGFTITDYGRFNELSAYFASNSGTCTGGGAMWDGGGTNRLYIARGSIGAGSHATNGQAWQDVGGQDWAFGTGAAFFFGFFRNSADSDVFSYSTSAGLMRVKGTGGNSPTSLTGESTGAAVFGTDGQPGAYGTYTPLVLYVRRSGNWVKANYAQARRSSAWSGASHVYVRRTGAWIPIAQVIEKQELDWKKEFEVGIEWEDGTWEIGLAKWHYDQDIAVGLGWKERGVEGVDCEEYILPELVAV